jgi:hypothetical protein
LVRLQHDAQRLRNQLVHSQHIFELELLPHFTPHIFRTYLVAFNPHLNAPLRGINTMAQIAPSLCFLKNKKYILSLKKT